MRATGATDCNEHSSRSHAILSFHVESQRVSSDAEAPVGARVDGPAKGRIRLGKLHLVDLAGRYFLYYYLYCTKEDSSFIHYNSR